MHVQWDPVGAWYLGLLTLEAVHAGCLWRLLRVLILNKNGHKPLEKNYPSDKLVFQSERMPDCSAGCTLGDSDHCEWKFSLLSCLPCLVQVHRGRLQIELETAYQFHPLIFSYPKKKKKKITFALKAKTFTLNMTDSEAAEWDPSREIRINSQLKCDEKNVG